MTAKSKTKQDAVDRAIAAVDRAIGRLIALLKSAEPGIGDKVLQGLERLGPAAIDFLAAELDGAKQDSLLRMRIASALASLGSRPEFRRPALRTLLAARLAEPETAVAGRMSIALGKLDPTEEEMVRALAGDGGDEAQDDGQPLVPRGEGPVMDEDTD